MLAGARSWRTPCAFVSPSAAPPRGAGPGGGAAVLRGAGRGSLRTPCRRTLSRGCTRPGGADNPGSCGRKQNPVGRSGGLNKTDDEGSSLQALLAFFSFLSFLQTSVEIPSGEAFFLNLQRPIGLKISALSRRALCQLEWCVSDSVESEFPFRGGRRWCLPLEKLAAWLISHIPLTAHLKYCLTKQGSHGERGSLGSHRRVPSTPRSRSRGRELL